MPYRGYSIGVLMLINLEAQCRYVGWLSGEGWKISQVEGHKLEYLQLEVDLAYADKFGGTGQVCGSADEGIWVENLLDDGAKWSMVVDLAKQRLWGGEGNVVLMLTNLEALCSM